jgi:RNA polymerase sigma-54 factor
MGLQQRLTPQQVQYLKLLQLPSVMLEQKIKEELEENPLLEEVTEDESLASDANANPLTIESPTQGATESAIDNQAERDDEKAERVNDYSMEDFMNDELEGFKAPRGQQQSEDEDREDRSSIADESFTDSVMNQLKMNNISSHLLVLAEEIIGSLDEDGYLRVPLKEIVQDVELYYGEEYTELEPEKLLKRIQHLDPPGIAARDLRECLLIQLELVHDHSPSRDQAIQIVKEHFEEYINKKYDQIAKKLNVKTEELKAADQLIQRLDPKPGRPSRSQIESTRYISPDFYIEKAPNDNDFIITLNERGVPTLRINASYKELAKKSANGAQPIAAEAKEFINKKFEAAKYFILAIYQRRETLLKVMQGILEHQRDFFRDGEKYLKPLIYKTIAEMIGMDISTICRVVNGKYCQCDHGVYELKYFFSEAIPTDGGEGEAVSNKVVKGRIKELLESENPTKPLSDEHLVEKLTADGYNVARRTVAKYREQMHIPVARLRKKIV